MPIAVNVGVGNEENGGKITSKFRRDPRARLGTDRSLEQFSTPTAMS